MRPDVSAIPVTGKGESMPAWIGTSGWHYEHWRGGLYPADLPARHWLEHFGQRFATTEINNAFYRLPERSTFETWAASVPDDFVFAVKASRYLTHVRRLREPAEPVSRLLERTAGLGAKLGPVLLQLPPNLPFDLDALEAVLRSFPAPLKVTVEFRHPSWFVPPTRELLERYATAWCLTDTDGHKSPRWRTADWGYLRLHGGRGSPPSCYGRAALHSWAEDLSRLWPEPSAVFVYFNNDRYGCAVRDAHRFALAADRTDLAPTRVAAARESSLTA
jgi:uncharacterized protein YecE (DUF72 family)